MNFSSIGQIEGSVVKRTKRKADLGNYSPQKNGCKDFYHFRTKQTSSVLLQTGIIAIAVKIHMVAMETRKVGKVRPFF